MNSRLNTWAAWMVARFVRQVLSWVLVGKPIRVRESGSVVFSGTILSVVIRFPMPDRPCMMVRAVRPAGGLLAADFKEVLVSTLKREPDGVWSVQQ